MPAFIHRVGGEDTHHIREFLRAMKMMRKEAMMKMAFFRASYALTIFSLSCEHACASVCVGEIIQSPTDAETMM